MNVMVVMAALAAAIAAGLLTPGPPAIDRARGYRGASTVGNGVQSVSGHEPRMPRGRRVAWGLVAGSGVAAGAQPWWGWTAILVGIGTGVGVVLALGQLESGRARRRRWVATVQAPEVLDLLAAGLQAGLPLRAVVVGVVAACRGPIVEDLERVMQLVELGTGEAEAWRSLSDHPQLGAVALDLARSVDSGTRLAESLSEHAAGARQLRRSALEVEARKVGVRSVLPLMVCFIPAFLLLGVVPTVASALQRGFAALG